MRRFERELITSWRRLDLPTDDATIVAAVSGGADSVSLLIAIDELKQQKKLNLRIVAAHFNHRLRDEASDEDEAFVRGLCAERKIEFAVGRSVRRHSSNIEQSARDDRYDFLRKTAANVDAFAVAAAHTMDDQAETFLLNLIRGSGVDGLAGMRPVRELGEHIQLIRPLMGWARRSATEAYCHDLGIDFRFDSMNEDEAFTRVRVRKVLLPLLNDFNPKIVERLAETARLLLQNLLPPVEFSPGPLTLERLRPLSDSEIANEVRGWLMAQRGDMRSIEAKHIDAICRLVNSRKSGKTVELPRFGRVTKGGGKLAFSENNIEKKPSDN
jgi:tRNA(Ile)-lysidine synthase